MTWRRRLALLLGAASPFTLDVDHAALALPDGPVLEPAPLERDLLVFADPVDQRRLLQLAGHRSHSSHSSHRSHVSGSGHSSHYSSAGSTVTSPKTTTTAPSFAPQTTPAPSTSVPSTSAPRSVAPAPSASAASPTAKMSQGEITDFIRKVQIALIVKGYDPGPVDGSLGGKTGQALKSFQTASKLPATGLIDVETLKRLGVLP